MEPQEASDQPMHLDSSQVKQQPEPEPEIESPGVEDASERSQRGKPAELASPRYSALLKTPLLPQYQHLTKSEAIEKLLHEHSGTVLHVDYIIRALYGELEPEDIKAAQNKR